MHPGSWEALPLPGGPPEAPPPWASPGTYQLWLSRANPESTLECEWTWEGNPRGGGTEVEKSSYSSGPAPLLLAVSRTPGHPESGWSGPGDQRMRQREAFSSGDGLDLAASPLAASGVPPVPGSRSCALGRPCR